MAAQDWRSFESWPQPLRVGPVLRRVGGAILRRGRAPSLPAGTREARDDETGRVELRRSSDAHHLQLLHPGAYGYRSDPSTWWHVLGCAAAEGNNPKCGPSYLHR